MTPSLSVIIPAYNEEKNIGQTVQAVTAAASPLFSDYEILIINDCSRDRTGEVVEALAAADAHIRVFHNEVNRGLGWNFRKGIELALKSHAAMVPGDNAFGSESLKRLFAAVGQADIVAGYTENQEVRPVSRQRISRAFTALCNFLFGHRLRYFNGPSVFRTADLRKTPMTTSGFAYMAEIVVRLLASGRTYVEVGMTLQEREFGASSALKWKNIVSVGQTLVRLFWETRVLGKRVPLG